MTGKEMGISRPLVAKLVYSVYEISPIFLVMTTIGTEQWRRQVFDVHWSDLLALGTAELYQRIPPAQVNAVAIA
jgi:hypothetical protein